MMDEDRQGWKAFCRAELFQAKAPSFGRGTPEIFSISPSSPNPNKARLEYDLKVLADQMEQKGTWDVQVPIGPRNAPLRTNAASSHGEHSWLIWGTIGPGLLCG